MKESNIEDEILGEKASEIESLVRQIINFQKEDNVPDLTEKEVTDVKTLVETIRKNPHLVKFIKKKYLENFALWIIENASIILNESQQKIIRDNDGVLLLDEKSFLSREHIGQGKMADKWFIIDGREFLTKDLFDENFVENTLIAEQIARTLNLPVAMYFPAKENGERKVLTLNFLKPDEKLIEGNIICDKQMDINKVQEILKDYLYTQKQDVGTIDEILTDYKKFILYSILINHRDAHNGNWGLVKDEKGKFRFSPIYDLEGCLSENIYKIRAFHCNQDYEDDAILESIMQDIKIQKFAEEMLNLDMKKVYENVYLSKKVQISNELIIENNRVINEQLQLIKRHLEKAKINMSTKKTEQKNK